MADVPMNKPLKQSEMINKMYYALFGINGSDGVIKKVAMTEEKVDGIHRKFDLFIESRFDTCPLRNDQQAKNRRRFTWFLAAAGWISIMIVLLKAIKVLP